MRRFLKTLFLTLLFFSLSGCFKQEEERGLQKNIEIKRNNPDEYVKKEDKNEIQKSVEKSETPKALPNEKSGFIEFNDKFFISQVNDIYMNRGDYLGKKVRIEGNASEFTDPETGKTLHAVLRTGPGCCAFDGVVGFEYQAETYPKKDEWVKVEGVLKLVSVSNKYEVLIIDATSVEVKKERGQERVIH